MENHKELLKDIVNTRKYTIERQIHTLRRFNREVPKELIDQLDEIKELETKVINL